MFDFTELELRAAAHMRLWAYDNSPRVKPRQSAYHVQVGRTGGVLTSKPTHVVAEGAFDQAALELAVAQSFGLPHAEVAADLQRLASAQPWDPAPPLRMGPQRCLSSRETIERLSTALPGLLPAEPYQVERTLKRAAMHWRDAFARDFPDRPEPRHVWMGGDYIDDGTSRG